MNKINLECPFCGAVGDFNDRDEKGIVCCHMCGRDFDSNKPKGTKPEPKPTK